VFRVRSSAAETPIRRADVLAVVAFQVAAVPEDSENAEDDEAADHPGQMDQQWSGAGLPNAWTSAAGPSWRAKLPRDKGQFRRVCTRPGRTKSRNRWEPDAPPIVSRMSPAIPHSASRRTMAPRPTSCLSWADVLPSEAAEGLVSWCGWHGMQGVRVRIASASPGLPSRAASAIAKTTTRRSRPTMRGHQGRPYPVAELVAVAMPPAGVKQFRWVATRYDKRAVDYLVWGHPGRRSELAMTCCGPA